MVQDDNGLEMIKKLKKDLKPNLYMPIWNTIICSGPPLNLIFRYFLERDIKSPTFAIILTVISMIWTILNWYWYVKERKNFKKNWEKISAELHSLNLQEKPSKDIIGTVYNILSITAIASLMMCIVSLVVAILSKFSFFKYLALFCILIFLITGGIMIIIGIVQLFSLIGYLKKYGRLKEILKSFILIYTLSFIILITISFIIHKSPEWSESLLKSLMITFPIFLYILVIMLYKEIKKEYLLDASPDENDSK